MQLHRPSPAGPVSDDADSAIAGLYAAHWRHLVRVAYLLLHDQAAAEDVVQDAYLATHRNWHKVRDQGLAAAYLRRAVVNGARSVLRHEQVVRRQLSAQAGRADALGRAGAESAETGAMRDLGQDLMLAALRTLPPRQQEVLVLRYYCDLSEAQIADALQIAPGSVKAHAHRALNALRATMEASS